MALNCAALTKLADPRGRRRLMADPALRWSRPSKALAPTPSYAERDRLAADMIATYCGYANASCSVGLALAGGAVSPDTPLPADVALYAAASTRQPAAAHVAAFASALAHHRVAHAFLEGSGTACGVAKTRFGDACPFLAAETSSSRPWADAAAVRRVVATDAWLRNLSSRPPNHWVDALEFSELGPEMLGTTKVARRATLVRRDGRRVPVVTKRGRREPTSGLSAACVAMQLELEVLALELLAGRRGVPKMSAAWYDEGNLVYAVADGGAPLGTCAGRACRVSQAFDAAAAQSPLGLLRSLTECFATWALAGFYLSDLTPVQFCMVGGDVTLIDAPKPFRSGLFEFAAISRPGLEKCDATNVAQVHTAALASKPPPVCTKNRDCPHARKGRCQNDERRTDARCAPEERGACVRGRCAPLTARSQVYALAAQPWLFPRVSRFVEPTLRAPLARLAANMTQTDPMRRPAFSDVLGVLDALRRGESG